MMFMNLVYIFSLLSTLSSAFRIEDSYLPSDRFSRVLIISDIHGDVRALMESLYLGYKEIVGPSAAVSKADFLTRFQQYNSSESAQPSPLYTGGDVALIQMGDLIDRGKYSLACLLAMNATEAVIGFKTITLLGNHELYAMMRDSLYNSLIHPEDDLDRDPSIFDRANGSMWHHLNSFLVPMVRWGPPARSHVEESPLNISEFSTLFVHAGITEEFLYRFDIVSKPATFVSKYRPKTKAWMVPFSDGSTTVSVKSVNAMTDFEFTHWSADPLKYKYAFEWSPFNTRELGEFDVDCASIYRLLRFFDVSRIVVGHTPSQNHQVRTNCDGRIVLTDIGASRFMTGFGNDLVPSTPGIVVMTANPSDNSLSNITAVYLNEVSQVITHEPIWANNSEQIQSINRWATDSHSSVLDVSPSIDGSPRAPLYPAPASRDPESIVQLPSRTSDRETNVTTLAPATTEVYSTVAETSP